ncbi:MAG: hypothetical protein ABFD89_00845 [Bryobacteraceae bacterium]
MASARPKFPTSMGYPILPQLPPWLAFTQGQIWHVKPSSGLDTNTGKSPRNAFKTLAAALAAATANQNDIVVFYGEGNASASCTDYQSTSLAWNKDLVHLVGINSGVSISPRARIAAISTYANAAPTMQVTANGCYFANLAIYMGVADTTPLGALSVSGSRNRFDNCHVLGIGADTNDIVGAYSLLLSGAEECEFHSCQFGSDRTTHGAAANSVLKFASTAKNIIFDKCLLRLVSTHATNHVFVRAAAGSLDGSVAFINGCQGINSQSRNVSGVELTYAMVVASDAGGDVYISPDSKFQAADVNSTDAGNVYSDAATSGIAVPLVK